MYALFQVTLHFTLTLEKKRKFPSPELNITLVNIKMIGSKNMPFICNYFYYLIITWACFHFSDFNVT